MPTPSYQTAGKWTSRSGSLMMRALSSTQPTVQRTSPHVWVPSTYFAEGYPYAIVNNLAEVLFLQAGAGLGLVGLTSLLHVPWNLKFLWAPWVDRVETKRRWMIGLQLVLAFLLFGLAAIPLHAPSLPLLGAVLLIMAFASATNDIAIDAYYMEALQDQDQAKFVGYRATAYKIATLLVKGPLLALLGVVGFAFGLVAMGGVLLLVALAHIWLLPESGTVGTSFVAALRRTLWSRAGLLSPPALVALALSWEWLVDRGRAVLESDFPLGFWVAVAILLGLAIVAVRNTIGRRPASPDARQRPAFAALMTTPRIGFALAFVICFRTGESFLQKMKWPFFQHELSVSLSEYALLNGTLGAVAGFVGTFVGGALIARSGLKRWFWWFILAQNLPNLAYAGLALVAPQLGGTVAPGVLAGGVICFDELGSGFGTAVLMVYLMRLCLPEHKATHFAVLTALMSLSFTFAGAASGFIAEAVGYQSYFVFTFVASLPMMILGAFAPMQGSSAAEQRPAS